MRILGFVISAAVLHAVVLVLSPDSNNHHVDEVLVGVALVQRQLEPLAGADVSSEGQEPISTSATEPSLTEPMDKVDEADLATAQASSEELIKPKLPVPINPPSPAAEEQLPAVVEESPAQPVLQPQPPPPRVKPVAAATPPDRIAALPPEQDISSPDDGPLSEKTGPGHQGAPVSYETSISVKPQDDEVARKADPAVALVTAQPRYGFHPAPVYPGIARRRGWEGTVEFNVRVLANGEVAEVTVKNSSGYKSLDQAARRAIKRWRFTPASRAGKVVESWVVVPVHFVLDAQMRSR